MIPSLVCKEYVCEAHGGVIRFEHECGFPTMPVLGEGVRWEEIPPPSPRDGSVWISGDVELLGWFDRADTGQMRLWVILSQGSTKDCAKDILGRCSDEALRNGAAAWTPLPDRAGGSGGRRS